MIKYLDNKNYAISKNNIVWSVIIISFFTIYNIIPNIGFLILGLATIVFAMLFLKDLQFFYLIFILIPNVMKIKVIEKPNALLGYFILMFCVKLLFTKKATINSNFFIKIFLGSFLFITSLLINSQDISFFIRVAAFIMILNIMYSCEGKSINTVILGKSYIFGCVLDVLSALFYFIYKGESVFLGYFSGIRDDRNYFSISCAVAIMILMTVIVYTKHFQLFEIISFILLSIGGILSNSRTFFIIYVIALIGFVFSFFKSSKVRIFFIALIIILIIGKNTFLSDFFDSLDSLLLRFEDDDVAGGNGRFESWAIYLNYGFSSLKNTLFGCGSSVDYLGKGILHTNSVEHNSIIQLIFTVGILGSIGYTMLLTSMANLIYKHKKIYRSFVRWMPLIALIIGYSTINGAFSDRFIYIFYLCMCILYLPSNDKHPEHNRRTYEDCAD